MRFNQRDKDPGEGGSASIQNMGKQVFARFAFVRGSSGELEIPRNWKRLETSR